jgi:hypothetical protein
LEQVGIIDALGRLVWIGDVRGMASIATEGWSKGFYRIGAAGRWKGMLIR